MEEERARIANKIEVLFKGRLVVANKLRDIIYEVEKYDASKGSLVLHRLFDDKGLIFEKSNVVRKELKLKVVHMLYSILPQEEELSIRQQMFSANDRTLNIKYQVIESECFPMQIKPEGVNITEYEIKFNRDTRRITHIYNKSYHYAPIKFEA